MSDPMNEERPEERDFIRPDEADLHVFGVDCPCGPERIEVSLEEGAKRGVAWRHNHLERPDEGAAP